MKFFGLNNKEYNLSNEQFLLYWAKYCSSKQGAIAPYDKIKLIKDGFFKDKKAISNALYQLHMKNFIGKYQEDWYITDMGEEYLANCLDASKPTNASSSITPEIKTYIDKLETENDDLKNQCEALKHKIDSLTNSIQELNEKLMISNEASIANYEMRLQLSKDKDHLRKKYEECCRIANEEGLEKNKLMNENASLRTQIEAYKAQIANLKNAYHGIDNNIKIAFQNCAKAFNIIAGMY